MKRLLEYWRLIVDSPLPGKINMQRDLAIMEAVAAGQAPPTLRLYRWSPPALSLGCFQKAAETADLEACRRLGVDVVRRPTGGRAVLHNRELTYSIAVPESHPLVPPGVLEAYRLLSRGIISAFSLLGIEAELASEKGRGGGPAPGSCFDTASAYEVRVRGKKVVGSAQLRRRGTLLQHGAVMLALPLELYRQVLRPQAVGDDPAYLEALGREAAGLNDLGYSVSPEELSAALVKGFAQALFVDFREESYPGKRQRGNGPGGGGPQGLRRRSGPGCRGDKSRSRGD